MDVSIIIINYNTLSLTKKCIDSIFQHTKNIQFEIILVDNASTDGSKKLFMADARIIYIYNEENVGFGRANNIGLKYASGRYILLLNSDTYLINNAINIFKENMDVQPSNIACIGALLEDPFGAEVRSFGPFLSFKQFFKGVKLEIPRPIPVSGVCVPVVLGADLFIRRSVIEKEGFFDPAFFMYHEENDLQRRYAQAGYYSKIIPGPRIVHLEGKSNASHINILAIQGGYIYMKKWNNRFIYIIYRILYAITRMPKLFMIRAPYNQKIKFLKALFCYRVPSIHHQL